MRIILEGTEAELRSTLHSFGIPNEVAFDYGKQVRRGHRQKATKRTFAELKAIAENHLNDFSGTDKFTIGFMSDSDNSKIKALAKEHADRCRQIHKQLNALKRNFAISDHKKYAREDDADRIYEGFKEITGRYIDD